MICRIAEVLVKVPEIGDLVSRCEAYRDSFGKEYNIIIPENCYRKDAFPEEIQENMRIYLGSGSRFYKELLKHNGMMLHASAVAYEGRAYLFSGPCGMGKSTHTRLWQQVFGESAVVFNDDKPALRRIDGKWYAYGTPWCGKDGINVNMKVPLAGICFLKRGDQNEITRLDALSASASIISQTMRRFKDKSNLTLMLSHVDHLVREIPVFQFKNLPVPDSARLSYETMCRAAEEVGL